MQENTEKKIKRSMGFIGCDFDGTLAKYEKYEGPDILGEPIPAMINRVRKWLSEGKNVKIFTARVADNHSTAEIEQSRQAIQEWCLKHIGAKLDVTAMKYSSMYEFWDDKAVGVLKNTGEFKKYE